jgi:hypothetical protein
MTDNMEKSEKTRKLVLGGTLIATLVFILLIEDEAEIYPIQPVQSKQTKNNYSETGFVKENNSEYLDVDQLGQRKFSSQAGELFNAKSWAAARSGNRNDQKDSLLKQTIQRAVSPPVTSKPPALRFQYLGKIIHNNQTKIILSQSGEKIVVMPGEHIDDQYRVDKIDNESITLTYLPLNAEQILIINNPGNK